MFLYVRRRPGFQNVVLLPIGGGDNIHAATIEGALIDRELNGVDVKFCYRIDGKLVPVAGAASAQPPNAVRLLKLKTILGDAAVVRDGLLDPDGFPAALNARVTLPNGAADARPARKKDARDVRWSFKAVPGLGASEGHELTDTLRISIPITAAPVFAVFTSTSGEESKEMSSLEGGNYWVTIENRDTGCDERQGNPKPGKYHLEEFRFLYELTKADPATFRYPEGKYGELEDLWEGLSECLPICGGADCEEP
jgi:hypothetical protein